LCRPTRDTRRTMQSCLSFAFPFHASLYISPVLREAPWHAAAFRSPLERDRHGLPITETARTNHRPAILPDTCKTYNFLRSKERNERSIVSFWQSLRVNCLCMKSQRRSI
jgi:hypothetical protein